MSDAQKEIEQIFNEAEEKITQDLKAIAGLKSRNAYMNVLTPPGMRPPLAPQIKEAINDYRDGIRDYSSKALEAINDRLPELSKEEQKNVRENMVSRIMELSGNISYSKNNMQKEEGLTKEFQSRNPVAREKGTDRQEVNSETIKSQFLSKDTDTSKGNQLLKSSFFKDRPVQRAPDMDLEKDER